MISKDKLMVLQELMNELQEEMEYGADDFASRLGRKPKVEMISIKAKPQEDMEHMEDMEGMEEMEEKLGMDLDGDMEEGEPIEHKRKVMGEGEMLKSRLMRLRKGM